MKRIKQIVVALLLVFGLFGSMPAVANAATLSTTEFGTFSYSLTRSGSTVAAKTSVTKTAKNLITSIEIQVNATGETLVNTSVTKSNVKINNVIKATNYSTSTKLACFSCHEARGTSSVARYLAEKF